MSREAGGVRRYRILRSVDDPNYAMVDLEFDSSSQATRFREALQRLWRNVDGKLIERPHARIAQLLELRELG